MSELEHFTDPSAFLVAAGEHLAADPVLNTVVTTVTERSRDEIAAGVPQDDSHPRWWVVARHPSGAVAGVAMRTAPFRPHPLFVLPMPDEAARALARSLHERGEEAAGINGALPAARVCAEEIARLTGGTVDVGQHTRLFELALHWFEAFGRDADEQAGREPGSMHEAAEDDETMRRRIAGRRIWFWVDEHGERVHLTGANAPSFGVARIGPVYTPREQRGRDYASAAVAEVTRQILAGGSRACLFTDQANPTSNRIYEALGYRAVVDMANLRVAPRLDEP